MSFDLDDFDGSSFSNVLFSGTYNEEEDRCSLTLKVIEGEVLGGDALRIDFRHEEATRPGDDGCEAPDTEAPSFLEGRECVLVTHLEGVRVPDED